MREHIRFFGHFLARPVLTGAIAPSSRWLAERMVEGVGLKAAETVVELGPGTGAFTRLIRRSLKPSSLFLALEINPSFAAGLVRELPGVQVINDSAERLQQHLRNHGRSAADCILSGLPWAGFPQDLQDRLLGAVVDGLRPGGSFSTFAYVHAAWLPPGRRFRRLLESHFSKVRTTPLVWLNLPPAFVYRCEK